MSSPSSPDLSRGIALLQDTLSDITQALGDCLSCARGQQAANPARQAEFDNALALLKASARIGLTLAQIQAKPFEHHIVISRQILPSKSPARRKAKVDQPDRPPHPPTDMAGSNAG